ncbi:MAG: efflux RND transporter periplasmic adaptor subunit [Chromatiales bacterium]|nr:efflux RND transporter periplasmic adaptor subunit [Chromatiales bacterium]
MRPVVLLVACLLAGCGKPESPEPVGQAPANLATEVVQPVTVPAERELDGAVEAVNQATVSAQTSGRVAEILHDVNDFVPAGALLMKLRSTEQRAGLQQAEAARVEATAREAEAQTRYARIRDMYERKVVAKAQLDQVAAERDAAVARLAAANAALDSAREGVAYTEVRAPYAGIVTARLVRVGESVSPGTPLMSGLSLEKLRVTVDIPQTLVEQVRRLRKAAVYVDGRRIEATQVTIFPEADPATNTFRTRVDLPPNAADLYPGMFVKVGFVTGESPRLLVPKSAIVVRSEVTAVYVVDGDGRVSLRQVRTGGAFGDRLEILAGLAAGERVALEPVAALRTLSPAVAGDDG